MIFSPDLPMPNGIIVFTILITHRSRSKYYKLYYQKSHHFHGPKVIIPYTDA